MSITFLVSLLSLSKQWVGVSSNCIVALNVDVIVALLHISCVFTNFRWDNSLSERKNWILKKVTVDTYGHFFPCMQIALFVSSSDAVQPGWLVNFLKGINSKRIREMQVNLAKVCQLLKTNSSSLLILPGFRQSKWIQKTQGTIYPSSYLRLIFILLAFFSTQGISYIQVQLNLLDQRT